MLIQTDFSKRSSIRHSIPFNRCTSLPYHLQYGNDILGVEAGRTALSSVGSDTPERAETAALHTTESTPGTVAGRIIAVVRVPDGPG